MVRLRVRWCRGVRGRGRWAVTQVLKESRTGVDRELLFAEMRRGYDRIIEFVTSPAFRAVHGELMSLPPKSRPRFVSEVLLNDDELRKRGVERPPDLLIQRSAFGDQRPTLFCVKKWLPRELHMFWENVNITFDNEYDDDAVPRDGTAWRPPLPVGIQDALLSGKLSDSDADAVVEALDQVTRLDI